ncbi:MAG: hypothetical protein AVW06_04630 [Hadesarchaea archaeon DG-33-1]|nr:MAG: hypothetical protein AVW06_04630 [Hadesarchaea archaeon DG-33-1]
MSERVRKAFRRNYPNLAKEWGGVGTVRIDAVRTSLKEAEKIAYSVHGYQPTIIDFIRRCENDDQALGIINFLERQGEIESSYARRLRIQLAKRGLRSFGKQRKPGCYERGETG